MKGPRYPLQTVLELRERERDAAQEELAERLRAVAAAEQELAERQSEAATAHQLAAQAAAKIDQPPTDGSSLDVREISRRREEAGWFAREAEQADRRVVVAEGGLGAAHRAVEAGRAILIERAQALTAIETHRDKWTEENRRELERREESLMQEIAISAWVRASGEDRS